MSTPREFHGTAMDQLQAQMVFAQADADPDYRVPYWLWGKLRDQGYDVSELSYDIDQAKEPHAERPVRFMNRQAWRAQVKAARHGR